MYIGLTALIYVFDLFLFVLVFLIIRSRRASARVIATVVVLAAVTYLASVALLVFVSVHFSPQMSGR
ncbi:MAG: hypothetical protein E6H03_04315 [Bacillati bacterium ANGP1]|uniref:Uncharacterized protein n=1 Tax=Candidatus Segetimicrobium genomatis TaxID=2569760 RepID=A0A537JHX1_9BACT|nr:MAG: hypothetical protein E6H03_04315 [Terrabacteria group bacterium ANGP1]